jgi:hypothetical protein
MDFTFQIVPRNPAVSSDHPFEYDHRNFDLLKIIAPDGTYEMVRKQEPNYTVWCGYSDEVRDAFEDMTPEQYQEFLTRVRKEAQK